MALGSAVGIDAWHLERLARLVERIEPVRVSDHACFARARFVKASSRPAQAPVFHAADLLPIAFTPASLDILCTNVDRVQERLRRSILVENRTAYLSFNAGGRSMPGGGPGLRARGSEGRAATPMPAVRGRAA